MNIFQQLFQMAESALQFASLGSGAWQFFSTNISQGPVAVHFTCG